MYTIWSEYSGEQVLIKIFPDGKFKVIISTPWLNEPDVVKQLAVRIKNLGEPHALFPLAADLRAKITAYHTTIEAYHNSIRNQKIAEAEEEIV